MRVLFVTHDHPLTGRSGVSVYCRDLLPALAERGATVGVVHAAGRDWRLRPYVRTSSQQHVTLFAMVNSPLNPGDSLHRPHQDTRLAALETLVRRCLRAFDPDLMHVQTLQGYPGSIVHLASDFGIPTVITLHDFWTLCPRLGLMRVGGDPCDGPDGGRNCVKFCLQPQNWRQRVYRWGVRLPDLTLRRAFLAARATYARRVHRDGHGSLWAQPPGKPQGVSERVRLEHARRSDALLASLTAAAQLLAVSDFVKSTYVRHGIPAPRIRTLPPALDLADRIPRRVRPVPTYPIRFGFLGRVVPMKGAHVFAQAASAVPEDLARFLLFGPATPETRRYLYGLSGDTPLEFRGPYARHELLKVLDEVDVVVVPSVVQETVGLVTLEAQAAGIPVIAARIGALPENVQDGEAGLLFSAGDADDLRHQFFRIIDDPSLVAVMSAHTRPPTQLSEHVEALLDIYTTVLAKGGRKAWKRSSA